MKLLFRFTLALTIGGWLIGCAAKDPSNTVHKTDYFAKVQQVYTQDISQCIEWLDSLEQANSRKALEKYYLKARQYFKYAEPVLAFMEIENYKFLNQPNILKVVEEDATDIKVKKPAGFQVLEEQIFTDSLDKAAIKKNAALTRNRLKLIRKNTRFTSHKPYHFLWLLRDAIARVALTGVTGFDSPVLEQSLSESAWIYQRLQDYLQIFRPEFKDNTLFKQWRQAIDQSVAALKGDFNQFDRYAFIQQHTHPQLKLWVKTVDAWQVQFPFTLALNHAATSLFSDKTFNLAYFSDPKLGVHSADKVALGKRLFNDVNLSADKTMSCASCHQAKKGFSDGLVTPTGQTRNSPTLLYAALQQKFFYDGRAGSLEGQIVSVVKNTKEFHTDLASIKAFINRTVDYKTTFEKLYKRGVNDLNIRHAIASYIRSLAPFNSRFDRNLNQQEQTLTEEEIKGFNLFMGKAKCATCHFPPTFNGTIPPNFRETELEMLAVPQKPDTANATIDPDLGRYHLFKVNERKFFFKTPTVRNVAQTAPYMHNGAYPTLESVVDFYNRGGGAGIGINQPLQTLPPDRLNLTEAEQAALVVFMRSLSDKKSKRVNNIK
ncbi:cytochrome c peroxidase [uncultured Microscilla sp.]|uniref:cytochrome-c peroxidase n=1 Tax=uncultured Microscilla sp. TaxID=432653 RepID=UPI0026280EA6|nr:cytochrome c peroxidase [uncultured Microscilla sp.]